jgi:formamidopyrimidine-DNA glycosylase
MAEFRPVTAGGVHSSATCIEDAIVQARTNPRPSSTFMADWTHNPRLDSTSSRVVCLMPELPDLTVYLEAMDRRIVAQRLERVLVLSPFLLRTAIPPIQSAHGRRVNQVRRIGKRIAIGLDQDLWLVLHLMIAGRLHWFEAGAPLAKRPLLARLEFGNGTLTLTEAGTKRRASLHLVQGERQMRLHDPGGIEILESSLAQFAERLRSENHTLKRALTDPKLFSGIGNAYSDEILHAARLSPVILTSRIDDAQVARLYSAVREQMQLWTERLRELAAGQFPEKVTAFRDGMAVHGRFGLPCPVCGTPVQRIRYADNETNYCARCQTGGRLLADRALSRLLKQDWPKSVDAFDGEA